jgi:hypothetical protein
VWRTLPHAKVPHRSALLAQLHGSAAGVCVVVGSTREFKDSICGRCEAGAFFLFHFTGNKPTNYGYQIYRQLVLQLSKDVSRNILQYCNTYVVRLQLNSANHLSSPSAGVGGADGHTLTCRECFAP